MGLEVDNYCFACGSANPIGLHLHFETTQEGVKAHFTPTKEYQGYINAVHGGIITTLLDEAMAHAVIQQGHLAVTARLEVKFKKPVIMDEIICLRGYILSKKGKIIETGSEIEQNGEIRATATAYFMIVGVEK